MVDVSKVEGPSGSSESFGKKDKNSVSSEKFKEAMRRRVKEVSQVDPDEQKKRKRREEIEEEDPIEEISTAPPASPTSSSLFSLEKEPKKIGPMDTQGPGISPIQSSQKATHPSPASKSFFHTPSPDEMADDSGMLEEESFREIPPSPSLDQPKAAEQFPSAPSEPSIQSSSPTNIPSMSHPADSIGPPESKSWQTAQRSSEHPSTSKPPLGPPVQKKSTLPAKEGASPISSSPTQTEGDPLPELDTSGFFEQFSREKEVQKTSHRSETGNTEEELEEMQADETGFILPSILPSTVEEKEEKKSKEKEKPPIERIEADPSGMVGGESLFTPASTTQETLPPYTQLHPQVMEIFDRMVGVMTVMNLSGITETVFTLNTPQFASSVFFGTQIIIQEFSTAPQAFNIQLNGSPQAVALFQGNANDLMAAFQAGNYNFRVNRLETGYLTERPLFKRKEKTGDQEKDTGDRQ